MKFDPLAVIVASFLGTFILIYPPFVAAVYVPGFIRIPLLFLILFFFICLVANKRAFMFKWAPFIIFFLFEEAYWFLTGNKIVGDTIYFMLFIILALSMLVGAERVRGLKFLMSYFYLFLVVSFSGLSILSFLAYNLDLVPYELKPVGEEEYYTNYHNIILGYISFKRFETFTIGRVCGYLFEPSYLGWFLTVNFFLLEKYILAKKNVIWLKVIVFLGAMGTFSTAVWVVFTVVFALQLFFFVLKLLKIRERLANAIVVVSVVLAFSVLLVAIPKDKLIESLGTSSSESREERVATSFLILLNSPIPDILFGKSPGYIEATIKTGESNSLVKTMVEEGVLSLVFILSFIIFCTKRSKLFMIANLIFLNTVLVLFTPLFIVNLLVCKWNDDRANEKT